MATWYPHAIRKPIPRNFGGKRRRTRAVICHVDAGGARSLQGWFSNPASGASSHFYVTYDGTVEQYVDADLIAWTQRAGNATAIGIETQGLGSGTWTPAQAAALAGLVRWLCDVYGIAKVDMVTSRPAASGIGMHRYGVDPYRASGGEVWGPRGKSCPGPDRARQFPEIVRAVAGSAGVGGGVVAPAPTTEAQRIAQMNAGYSVAWIKAIQQGLNILGTKPRLDEDGVRGSATISAVKAFQRQHGLVADGLPGVATSMKIDELRGTFPAPPKDVVDRALTIKLQQAVRVHADGKWGKDTDWSLDAVRAASLSQGGKFPYGVVAVQRATGARQDDVWGPNSRKAHDATIGEIQRALGRPVTGTWTQADENRYKAARAAAFGK